MDPFAQHLWNTTYVFWETGQLCEGAVLGKGQPKEALAVCFNSRVLDIPALWLRADTGPKHNAQSCPHSLPLSQTDLQKVVACWQRHVFRCTLNFSRNSSPLGPCSLVGSWNFDFASCLPFWSQIQGNSWVWEESDGNPTGHRILG